ncbi:hypothetical protein AUJ42_02180 [Candidatus Collierbacteria bacterium CG1_02_44_10]|uniref:DUF5667 domain-containing protein n=3 Tax=Candidatus Collieribacteriota TaxID=1752725 RepID=A0A2H0VN25_9BACT|nr:hypothetical protein [bacterium]OIN91120.1 MAG: hypothetical protein AUJ42_02180 [Candidatus Collierbacteria bacterium CG1_02_44_10]PIR99720.1 MAG: hypothetical protein COT86_02410 [Candidatus Collierbacteria bacterium CG10_big_fil_rev_8_21_14_0_10_43_36]PIZ24678.1 MAG: hypothetical protein COY48_01550 [Candidatus Collierbacteria bacterium CG_4_10_14_0_8_um_filter_43_86]PJB48627.1 MAG: hypothetical protein CO104_00850 [Candidatus Collierbacteria bacterium CG_4_9_14_3_um_filter_43_16]
MNKLGYLLKLAASASLFLIIVSPSLAAKPDNAGNSNAKSGKPVAVVSTVRAKACQARVSAIKTRMTQLTKLVTTMETTLDKITERVQGYYTNKVLPSGRSLTNYNSLTSNITSNKALVQTALDKAQADILAFSCTSANPRTQVYQFNTNMRLVKNALKAYRTSINKLIVTIRTIPSAIPTPTN